MFLIQSRISAFTQTSQTLQKTFRRCYASPTSKQATDTTKERLWKITLKRSPIGLHPNTRENARVLGLTRCGHVVFRPVSNELAGKILKIKEIVKVELVDKVTPIKNEAASGFQVIGRMNPVIAPGSKAAKPLLPLRKRE
ncbi:hypothetical protein IWW36_000146 [Coemansia brasiliensis]|uniref:Large ribosomal subunit protein uL30m n=1 Tax=Coemansia brasiliensis TaxID=2650707 RepID=A0A9W8IJ29_9FUNG|nr:hypothetical protein IWW36_000146 [Coemansia brasiliensis]